MFGLMSLGCVGSGMSCRDDVCGTGSLINNSTQSLGGCTICNKARASALQELSRCYRWLHCADRMFENVWTSVCMVIEFHHGVSRLCVVRARSAIERCVSWPEFRGIRAPDNWKGLEDQAPGDRLP